MKLATCFNTKTSYMFEAKLISNVLILFNYSFISSDALLTSLGQMFF